MHFAWEGTSALSRISFSRKDSGCCEVVFWLCCGYKLVGQRLCIFFCGTIVTFLVTVSLRFSCSCKQGLIMTNGILPAAKSNSMLFDFLHTGRYWALPVLLLFLISQHQVIANELNVPFACLSPVKSSSTAFTKHLWGFICLWITWRPKRKGHIFLQVSLAHEAIFISKEKHVSRSLLSEVCVSCSFQPDVPTIHFFHIHSLPRQEQALA